MHADEQEKLWRIGGRKRDSEPIAGSVMRMGAGCGTGFDERGRVRERAAHAAARAPLGGVGEAGENLADAWLVAAADDLDVGARDVQRGDEPLAAEAHERG